MTPDGTPKTVLVAIGVVVDADGARLLICRRQPDAVLAGLWEFPGGKIEPGESPADAAVREVREELGIEVASTGALEPITHAYAHAIVTLTPILCRHLSGEPQAIGCAEWRWVLPTELADFAFPEANAPLLAWLVTHLDRCVRERATD